jgi:transposase
VLIQRGRSRQKVSVLGALVISPRRRRVRAYFGLQPQASFDGERVIHFLKQLLRTLRTRIVLIWDRNNTHRGEPTKTWLHENRHRIRAHLLPAYAPELNPVELIWGHTKGHTLANFTPLEFQDLITQVHFSVLATGDDQSLLRSFLKHSPLPMRIP